MNYMSKRLISLDESVDGLHFKSTIFNEIRTWIVPSAVLEVLGTRCHLSKLILLASFDWQLGKAHLCVCVLP